ncbi:MAG TPA: dicarboxylate/amino acid:cation symporter [Gemmatimonadaceae bacterium]|nr:dicarboxylate/amino acid:cation symporter [Gemmatimonadaceae bacterium]
MSLTAKVLVALVAGLAGGLALSTIDSRAANIVVGIVEPVGTAWVNGIRMTVIPLVVSSLIAGIAKTDGGTTVARMGGRGLAVFLTILIASGMAGAFVSTPILLRFSPDAAATAHLRTTAAASGSQLVPAGAVQTPAQWLVSLVPANPIRAAADGAMLPVILFALMLGLALVSLPRRSREKLIAVLCAVEEAMLVIVRWLLAIAPLGVFALALPLVARLGVAAIGALATYVVLVSLVAAALAIFVIYPAAAWGGGISLRSFARAAAPAQAVAFSSRSSIAALPALIDTSRTRLRLPEEATTFFLPLASAVFRPGAVLGLVTGAVFIARLYGVHLGAMQILTLVATSIVTSFSIPGIPGGSIVAMAPVLASVGLPIEGIGILLGVDTIPDLFRTTTNVTGQLAAAAIVARGRTRTSAS